MSNVPKVSPTQHDVAPLSGLVSGVSNGRLAVDDLFRRYAGSLMVRSRSGGILELSQKRILYEIGRVSAAKAHMLRQPTDSVKMLRQPIDVSEVVMTDLVSACKKFTATPPTFSKVDLSAVGEMIGRAIAAYVQTGTITCGEIRQARPMSIATISVRESPVNPALGHVMIPRSVDTAAPGVFAVLCACVNACGSRVYTDQLTVDINNAVTLSEPRDANAAYCLCVGASYLISMYEASGEGTTMAYAIMKGMHAVASVVGHSDEGGYMRDVLRAASFAKPYGGITAVGGLHTALPLPTSTAESTFVSLLDSILLGTAGLFARADPLVDVDGRKYPTTFTASQKLSQPGEHVAGTSAMAADLQAQIAIAAPSMCTNYIALLGELFKTSGGEQAAGHLMHSFVVCAPTRHLEYAQVAPYFWIEPTSLYRNRSGLADAQGYGIIAGTCEHVVRSPFESYHVTQTYGGSYFVAAGHRSMRTSAIFISLLDHRLNGMGAMVPTQFISERCVLKGGNSTFDAARTAGDSIDMYHWARQQNSIPHPAAFIYTGSAIGYRVTTTTYDNAQNQFTYTHAPTVEDLASEIVFHAEPPFRIDNGPLGWAGADRDVKRARTTASDSLANARLASQTGVVTGGEVVATGNYEPTVTFGPPDRYEIGSDATRMQNVMRDREDIASKGPREPLLIEASPHRIPLRTNPGRAIAEGGFGPPSGGPPGYGPRQTSSVSQTTLATSAATTPSSVGAPPGAVMGHDAGQLTTPLPTASPAVPDDA